MSSWGTWLRAALLSVAVNLAIFSLLPFLALIRGAPDKPREPLAVELVSLLQPKPRQVLPRPRIIPRPPHPPPRKRPRIIRRLVLPSKPRVRVRPVPRLLRMAKIDLAGNIGAGDVAVAMPPPAPVREVEVPQPEEPEPAPPPVKIKHVPPVYPNRALSRGKEGHVRARLLVDEKGSVKVVKILECKGYQGFARAAKRAMLKWRFKPSRVRDCPIAAWCEQCVYFRIRHVR